MQKFLQLALPALLAISRVSAQELVFEAEVWNEKTCGKNLNDPKADSIPLDLWDNNEIKSKDDLSTACRVASLSADSFKKEEGIHQAFIDEKTVKDGCTLIIYKEAPELDEEGDESGACWNFLRRVPPDDKCTSINLPPKFGYAYCCDPDDCEFAVNGLTKTPPSKRVTDVTQVKKSNPFEKRKECKFESDSTETVMTYGEQEQVKADVDCTNTKDACQDTLTFTYSASVTNSWGMSAGLGGELFKALSVSVEFSYTYEETETKGVEGSFSGSRPAGSKGFITFTPRVECGPKGKFVGDCDDWETDKEGRACFPIMSNGLPIGETTFVQTN